MTKTIPLFSLAFACIPTYLAAETFTLATFNIRCPADQTPHTWQERANRCIKVIEQNKFDIFGVQEANKHQLDDLVANGIYS